MDGRPSFDDWSSHDGGCSLPGQHSEGRASFESRFLQPAQQVEGWASCQGRPSLEGRPPLPGQLLRRANTAESAASAADSTNTLAQHEPVQAGIMDGQCPGCGLLSGCCCKVGPPYHSMHVCHLDILIHPILVMMSWCICSMRTWATARHIIL